MNKIVAKVTKIDTLNGLNIVKFDSNGTTLSMMSLELGEDVKVGCEVELTAKATHIAIAKNFSGDISYSNQIKAKISEIQKGELLSSLNLDVETSTLESVITSNSLLRMDLKVGDEVTLFIKASELSIVRLIK